MIKGRDIFRKIDEDISAVHEGAVKDRGSSPTVREGSRLCSVP